jgi:ADP-heptose:LPS heptosyltransferase
VVLFPGALGDLLCCWPALAALRAAGERLTLVAHPMAASALPADALTHLSIDRREIADLFATAPLRPATQALLRGHTRVESFTGYGDPNFATRLAQAGGQTPAIHPFRAMRRGEHASHYYARCLDVVAGQVTVPVSAADAAWAAEFWQRQSLGDRVLAVHPGSGSRRKNWEGMAEPALAWRAAGGRVLALAGPAEAERPCELPCDARLQDESLPRVAASLQRAQRYLGNDSGVSHLAGLVGARGVAVFGDSDPDAWRPLGALQVVHAPHPCPSCGADRLCVHRLPVERVLAALAAS